MDIRIEESPTRGLWPELESVKSRTKQRVLQKWHRFFGGDDSHTSSPVPTSKQMENQWNESQQLGKRRDFCRTVGVGLPRPGTFRRQDSERRDRLEPILPCPSERRALSAQRQKRAVSAYRPRQGSSARPQHPARISAPSLPLSNSISDQQILTDHAPSSQSPSEVPNGINKTTATQPVYRSRSSSPSTSPSSRSSSDRFDELARDEKHQIDSELDTRWILNLSMHFRDKSDREKFFVTFAEKPNRWRRVTISCDYRDAEPDSLETDLKELHYQRDKSAQIYESLRDSLPSIQFYNTVTNLKLQTENGRLHVHVTEDANEIIPYPPRQSVNHILTDATNPIREAQESQIHFITHLSGFVYKVSFQGQEYIKKEIPGPDTVDEFLYEINALHALSDSESVIRLEAVVLDDSGQLVKGLLISYAKRGAVVDLLYDYKNEISWTDRSRWARQAIQGLSEIHEEGYVQGDFTLSNIVVNGENDAKIIDINRRGCPVGWEPPEIAKKLASNQRISMFIGQKTDLYQLGMTLWALAMEEDEPERHDQPLSSCSMPDEVPDWFKEIVEICLSPQPRDRWAAKELLRLFPRSPGNSDLHQLMTSNSSTSNHILDDRPLKYIEPDAAVERDDLERLGRSRHRSASGAGSDEEASLIDPPSSSYHFESGSSCVGIRKGRRRSLNAETAGDGVSGRGKSDEIGTDACGHIGPAPRTASISPGRDSRPEGSDRGSNANSGRQHSRPAEHRKLEEPCPHDQRSGSGEPMTQTDTPSFQNTISETQHDMEPTAEPEADLELPDPHWSARPARATSITSDSTPRNTTSTMAASTISIPPPPMDELTTADLAGLGGHPTLEEYSPHEPMKTPDTPSWQHVDTPSTDTFPTSDDNHLPELIEPSGSSGLGVDTLCTTKVSDSTATLMPIATTTATSTEENQPLPVPS